MKKTLCAAVVAVSTVVLVPGAAHADTPRCVTRAEYRAVHAGMTKRRVHRIFDIRGHRDAFARVGATTSEIRGYRPCRRHSAVSVSYGNGKLTAKSAIWG